MKIAADENLSNNLKSIMLILDFILGEMKNITRLKILEFFYKSSDYSTTFIASRVAWVAKESDNAKELACGFFLR